MDKEFRGCNGVVIGAILGVFAGILAYDLVAEIVDAPEGVAQAAE